LSLPLPISGGISREPIQSRSRLPGAMPQAGMGRAFGAGIREFLFSLSGPPN
jgi:hypothetical protein